MPDFHPSQVRRLLQKCAIIAAAHSQQAAIDIRRSFKVAPEFSPRKIYVAGPYIADTSDGIAENIERADHVARNILARGEIPIVPHKLTAGWPNDARFADWNNADWVARYCVPLLLGCDGIAMCPGWEKSKGSVIEHDTALRMQIPVTYETL